MEKILTTVISFLFSTFSIVNVANLPQSEDIINTDEIDQINFNQVINTMDIGVISNIDIEPEKVSSTTATSSTSNWWEYPDDIKEVTRSGNEIGRAHV